MALVKLYHRTYVIYGPESFTVYHLIWMGSGDIKAPLYPISISQQDFPLFWWKYLMWVGVRGRGNLVVSIWKSYSRPGPVHPMSTLGRASQILLLLCRSPPKKNPLQSCWNILWALEDANKHYRWHSCFASRKGDPLMEIKTTMKKCLFLFQSACFQGVAFQSLAPPVRMELETPLYHGMQT